MSVLATGNDPDAMRVQMTPARAPERATGVAGGRFHDGGVATAAGHLGKRAIHRLRTPGHWGRSESRTRPRATALREHGRNRSAARAGGSHEPAPVLTRAACTPRQRPAAFTTAVGNQPGPSQVRPATARASAPPQPDSRTATHARSARRRDPTAVGHTRRGLTRRRHPRRTASRRVRAVTRCQDTTRYNTPGARSRPYITASPSTQARV
jgi:hypothetical protein